MSLWIVPIRMEPAEVQIDAPRPLVYARLTLFTAEGATEGPTVLRREASGALIVEFRSTVRGLLGGEKTHRTVERVTLSEPEELRFLGLEGPLALLRDRISLIEAGSGTLVRYESTFGLKGSILGWLLGIAYVKRVLARFMRAHLSKLKDSIERGKRGERGAGGEQP